MAELSVSATEDIIEELKGREDFAGVIVEIDTSAPSNRAAVITNHVSDTIASRGRRVAEVLAAAAGQVERAGL